MNNHLLSYDELSIYKQTQSSAFREATLMVDQLIPTLNAHLKKITDSGNRVTNIAPLIPVYNKLVVYEILKRLRAAGFRTNYVTDQDAEGKAYCRLLEVNLP